MVSFMDTLENSPKYIEPGVVGDVCYKGWIDPHIVRDTCPKTPVLYCHFTCPGCEGECYYNVLTPEWTGAGLFHYYIEVENNCNSTVKPARIVLKIPKEVVPKEWGYG
jgi:hypothetical protein